MERAVERRVVAAIGERRLPEELEALSAEGVDVDGLRRSLGALAATQADDEARVVRVLADAGVEASPVERSAVDRLVRVVVVEVPGPDEAEDGLAALAGAGFEPWGPRSPGARRAFGHNTRRLEAVGDEGLLRVVLRWGRRPERPAVLRRLEPTTADLTAVDLPSAAWPAYWAIRPVRLLAERLRLRSSGPPDLGPFLATPPALAEAVVDVAGIGSDDTVVDLGCGDGRLLVAAARRGAQVVGVERDAALAEAARRRLAASGVDAAVAVGDLAEFDLADATVVVAFLPVDAVAARLGGLLSALAPGARLVVHEQAPLRAEPAPDRSIPVITAEGVTVVHEWTTVTVTS